MFSEELHTYAPPSTASSAGTESHDEGRSMVANLGSTIFAPCLMPNSYQEMAFVRPCLDKDLMLRTCVLNHESPVHIFRLFSFLGNFTFLAFLERFSHSSPTTFSALFATSKCTRALLRVD